jgi:hypothetical protein
VDGTGEVNKVIELLLNKRVNQRICNFTNLKSLHFFRNFNWDDLLDCKIKPPYIPEVREWKSNLENCHYLFEDIINVIIYLFLE